MPDDIRMTTTEDLSELGRFLIDAFQAAPDASFAARDVLHWKWFDPIGEPGPPRSLVACRDGTIVGHIGLCPTSIHNATIDPAGIPAIHPIDWVVSDRGVGLGAKLLWRVHRMARVHLAIGLTSASRAMADRTGYRTFCRIPVYRKVFRPSYRLRASRAGGPAQWVGVAREALRMIRRTRPTAPLVDLEPISEFGAEVEAIVLANQMPMAFTRRDPALLNHMLRFPRGWFSGWNIQRDGRTRGFGLLSVVPKGPIRVGKLSDCFLDVPDRDLWRSAVVSLTDELRRLGADYAESFGTTPWLKEALRSAGYRVAFDIPFYLRDRSGLVPKETPLHLTQLEADYSYT